MHRVRSAILAIVAIVGLCGWCHAQQVLAPPPVEVLKSSLETWLQTRGVADPSVKTSIDSLWNFGTRTPSASERFEALIKSFYLADEDTRELVDACQSGEAANPQRTFRAVTSRRDEPLYSNNMRAYYGRFLATATLNEEALAILKDIDLSQAADPAAVLFYKAVCEVSLLERDDGLETLDRLLDSTQSVAGRYRVVGELMRTELKDVKEKSLDEVSRQMSDVKRRLALGRAGERVQRVEDQIVVTLDEIIKKMEEQNSGGGGGGGGGPQSPQQMGGEPQGAEESYLGGMKGKGVTDRKDIGHKDGWGNLPEKSQAVGKKMLENEFPGHYRQAVQEYLKRLAERTAPSKK
jgi:hypothetical protein